MAALKTKIDDVKGLIVDKSKTMIDSLKGMSDAQKKKVAAAAGVGVFAGVGWFGVANAGPAATVPAGKKK